MQDAFMLHFAKRRNQDWPEIENAPMSSLFCMEVMDNRRGMRRVAPFTINRRRLVMRTVPEILLHSCGACRPTEKVLFVTDPSSKPIADEMLKAAKDFPKARIVVIDKVINMHGQDPDDAVAEAMLDADVIYGITKWSLYHSNPRRQAAEKGARFVNMVDYNMGMFGPESPLNVDFEAAGTVCSKVAGMLSGRKTCRIISERGTDVTCSIEGVKPTPQYGRSLNPGAGSSPPDIECATCAVHGTMNGVAYIDGSIPHPSLGLIHDEIKLTIKDGLVVEVSGGGQAKVLEDLLTGLNDYKVYIVGEIGIGLNPRCKLSGSMLEDEGCYGTIHFGLGSNTTFGGTISSPNHLDLVFRAPSMMVDDFCVIKNGEVQA